MTQHFGYCVDRNPNFIDRMLEEVRAWETDPYTAQTLHRFPQILIHRSANATGVTWVIPRDGL
jgi:hypothetical protein